MENLVAPVVEEVIIAQPVGENPQIKDQSQITDVLPSVPSAEKNDVVTITSEPTMTQNVNEQQSTPMIEDNDSTSSSDSSDSSDSEIEKAVDIEDEDQDENVIPKTKNEIAELPPPEPITLQILPEHSLVYIGTMSHTVDNILVVQSDDRLTQFLDLDNVLCLQDRTVLGRIEEVFGQVQHPFYTVRFKDEAEAKQKMQKGAAVFFVPELSQMVKLEEIKNKGSDASNANDEEPLPEEVEYSDDEEEAKARAALKASKQKSKPPKPKKEKKKQQPQVQPPNMQYPYSGAYQMDPAAQAQYQAQMAQYQAQYAQYQAQYQEYAYQYASGYNYPDNSYFQYPTDQTQQYPQGFGDRFFGNHAGYYQYANPQQTGNVQGFLQNPNPLQKKE